MTDFTGWSVATCVGLAVAGVAYGLCAGWRHQAGGPDRAPVKLLALLSLLVPAAVVLVLTVPVLTVCRQHDAFGAWLQPRSLCIRAWFAFWWLVLLIDGLEFALRFVYALRGRPFPVPALIRNILHFLLVVGALLLVAKTVLDRDISTALASTALLTAVVGFALQGVLGNLLAGMSMHIVRSTVPGDWVAIGDVEGEVLKTNWRETRLRTVGGHMLVVPNSKVAESVIHNMTYPTPLRRIRIGVGASYSDAPADVIAALEAAALGVPEVEREPGPSAVLTEYKDFGINYDLRFWTNRYFERTKLISDVQCRIWYQFKRQGIEIPFPMSDKLLNDFMEVVYTQRTKPPEDKKVEQHIADLRQSDFCRKLLVDADGQPLLSDDELRPVARSLRRVQFTKGETLFTQGETGETAYVLVRGSVNGRVEFQADVAAHTFMLEAGVLLGEMSLMTGLPRTATLQAANEVELLEIPKAAFVQLLGLRPDVPAKLAELAARRAAQNAAMYEKLKAMPATGLTASLQCDNILHRFKRMLQR
jgi:small-conductance mechanosensitive channel/CRP-like cAMP-binding protein